MEISHGVIDFGNNKTASYIIVHDSIKDLIKPLIYFLINNWKLTPPSLIVSIIGGANFCNLSKKIKDVYTEGLREIISTKNSWIFTGGSDSGVMSLTGQVVLNNGITIGIAPLSSMASKECFKRSDNNTTVTYMKNNVKDTEYSLEPNHRYFILVDSDTAGWGPDLKIRTALEHSISREYNTQICSILIEGGLFSIAEIKDAIQAEQHVVVLEGSGRASNIIPDLYYKKMGIQTPELNFENDFQKLCSREDIKLLLDEIIKLGMKYKTLHCYNTNIKKSMSDFIFEILNSK